MLWVFGVYCAVLGAWQIISPGSFFELVGPFGGRNDHYIRDAATFELANAVLLLGALRWHSWRTAALVFTAARFGMHTLNHLWDIGQADPYWVGVVDFVFLAISTAWLVVALLITRSDRQQTS
ncbi:hypothetical protein GOARA_043_00810 [Gordonia araii NBRC 100433]|uniref:DoxX family protein n=1 Tax=Gordonia araii NBRC 100433 TaxID=1073574 RepID=G7H145_9ACTN|nr:hypothetical protein GOARA_043_00810 [Gordonia araii NBRC 100433]